VAALALAATAAEPAKEKKYVDPNEFASYGPGTASKAGDPSAVEWQKANDAAIKAATTPEALKAHLKDAAAAKALLAKVKWAYASDPMVLTVAAAVSQHVMQPDDCGWLCAIGRTLAFWRTDERDVWTEALLDTATKSSDVYVQMFCLEQLLWCVLAKQSAAVRTFGEVASDKAVKDFAAWVARELEK
jgi:hypothetical protein